MSKAGQRLLRGAYQALAYAKGKADPDAYRVHHPDKSNAKTTEPNLDLDDASIATDADSAQGSVSETAKTLSAVEKQNVASNNTAVVS